MCCPGPSTSAPTWHGCASAISPARSRGACPPAGACSRSAAACRSPGDPARRGAGERDAAGLDLLALESTFAPSKRVGRVEARFATLPAPWEALSGLPARGYEIRHGSSRSIDAGRNGTARTTALGQTGSPIEALPDGLGFVDGPVLGVYPHGLLEDPAIVRALLGQTPRQSVEQAIDELTDAVLADLDLDQINALAGVG